MTNEEFIKKAEEQECQLLYEEDEGHAMGIVDGFLNLLTLLSVLGLLFGVPYLISLGWHAAM